MRLAVLRTQVEAVADLRTQRRIDPCNGRSTCKIEMDERVGAERLDQLDADRNAICDAWRDGKMLGAHAQHGLAGFMQPRTALIVERDVCSVIRKHRGP